MLVRYLYAVTFLTATYSSFICAETPLDESNSWAFVQPKDPFDATAILDLRTLNEPQSGQSGFVRLSPDKNDFVRGDGEPLRFWIVGSDGYGFAPAEMDEHARWLSKLGVNMVRLHVTVCKHNEGDKITDLDETLIDGIYRFIKSAKASGIYVLISPFYAHFDAPSSWELPGGVTDMEGLIFIEPKLQKAYREWTRQLYTRVNPYTGLAIKNDPTVAILQIHNEDSLLFWTSQQLKDHSRKQLANLFSQWLSKKYGSVEKAWQAWGDGFKGNDLLDDVAGGQIACLKVYDLTTDIKGAFVNRQNDTAQFIAELQYDFYRQMGDFLRNELGCKQLLNATNWRTASDSKLKALERYSYHALDVDAENEYVGSDYQHVGENDGYRIDPGHYLVNESVLGKPFEMCTNWRQEVGFPFILTETAWKNPNRYQSEGPFLAAAYQSLTGVDGVAWFSCQTPRYETDPLKPFWRVGDQMCIHKWSHNYPAMMAGFPANAILYRQHYLQQADPVVNDVRTMEEIFARVHPRIHDNEAYGDQRQLAELQPGWNDANAINRTAFLMGPVMTKSGGNPKDSVAIDTAKFLDAVAGTIRSTTGELIWDYHRQVCMMDAPQAQGVTGFLKASGSRFDLTDCLIESSNEYATVNIVSLDQQPLAKSKRVLVQCVTVNRLTGYATKPASFQVGQGKNAYQVDGEQIVRIGKPPLRMENSQVTISFKNKALRQAQILDMNGYLKETQPVQAGVFTIPNDAIYVVLSAP